MLFCVRECQCQCECFQNSSKSKKKQQSQGSSKSIVHKEIFEDLSFTDAESSNNTSKEALISEPTVANVIENVPKRKRNQFEWTTHSTYENLEDALEYLENEGFVHYDDSDLNIGQKFYFRCKRTPKTLKPYCASRYTLFLPSDRNEIILLHNGHDHDHNELMKGKKRLMSDEMIDYVNQLFEKDVTKYSQIVRFIDQERAKNNIFVDEPNPDKRQIEYRLKKFRNIAIKPMIDLGDLVQWCNDNAVYPKNDDDAFVLAYESSSMLEPLSFRFCLSTPR